MLLFTQLPDLVQPVGHYTLASVYATKGDYIAASLHLRAALHISVFKEAQLSLKLIRCSLKFKEEQKFLRQKLLEKEREIVQKENERLVREVADAVVNRRPIEPKNEPPIVIENIEPPEIPEMKVQEVKSSDFTGDDAIRYLTSVSLLRNARLKKLEEEDRQVIVRHLSNPEETMKRHESFFKKPSERASKEEASSSKQTTDDGQKPTPSKDKKSSNETESSSSIEESAAPTAQPPTETRPDPKQLEEELEKAVGAKESQESAPPKEVPPRKHRTHEEIRDEELKKKFPGIRPWPTVEECIEKPPPRKMVFTSTWLSVTAKGAK